MRLKQQQEAHRCRQAQLMQRRMQLMHRSEEAPPTPGPSTPGPPTPGGGQAGGPGTPGPIISQNQPNSKGGPGNSTSISKPMVANNGKPGMNMSGNQPFSPQPQMHNMNQQQQQNPQQQQMQSQQQIYNQPNNSVSGAPIGAVIAAQEVVNMAMQEQSKPPNISMRQVCSMGLAPIRW